MRVFDLKTLLAFRILIAALIGGGISIWILSLEFIVGTADAVRFPRGDQAQALTGALYFFQDHWHLPLFAIENTGFDLPVNLAFTDSIPLLALIFKPLSMWLSMPINYFGYWILICFVLQSVFFILILDQLRIRGLVPVISGAIMICLAPAMLYRFWLWHPALCGHFLLTAAIFGYLVADHWRSTHFVLFWGVELIAALWIHPYFLAMTYPVFMLAIMRRQGFAWHRQVIANKVILLVAVTAAIVLAGWIGGHIGAGFDSRAPSDGYGIYSMNLLAPFGAMGMSTLFPGGGYAQGTAAQIDGFNYLGAGVFFGSLLSLVVIYRDWSSHSVRVMMAVMETWPLLILVVLFALYSLSNRIYFADMLIAEYEVPGLILGLFDTFRASGRFFWIVYPLMVATIWWIVSRAFTPPKANVIILTIVGLQLIDTSSLRDAMASEKPPGEIAVSREWHELISRYHRIELYPPSHCTDDWDNIEDNFSLQLLAGYYGLSTNSVSSARLVVPCETRKAEAKVTALTPGKLVFFRRDVYGQDFIESRGWADSCDTRGQFYVCSSSGR
ncbi:hypothetical protein CCR96_03985 [Halochromatium roseum]|nr:hypothetical protein [Halochromatium roseum]